MSEHTNEPWSVDSPHQVFAESIGEYVAITEIENDGRIQPEVVAANARRIVACVNACAGIKTTDLEAMRGTSILAKANASFDTAEKQRDQLQAALSATVEQRDQLRIVCAEAYQMAGALGAPTAALDNLSAAAAGEQLPHETFLPVATPGLIEQRDRLLEALNIALELPTVILWWAEKFKLPEGLIESAKRYDAETRAAIASIERQEGEGK